MPVNTQLVYKAHLVSQNANWLDLHFHYISIIQRVLGILKPTYPRRRSRHNSCTGRYRGPCLVSRQPFCASSSRGPNPTRDLE